MKPAKASDPVERRQAIARAAMSDELLQLLPQIEELVQRLHNGDLLAAHEMGMVIRYVCQRPETYGHDCVENTARFINIDPRWLDDLHDIAHGFSRQEIERLCKRIAASEAPDFFTVSHLFALAKIRVDSERQEFTERALAENWSAHKLVREILRRHGPPVRVDRVARPASMPPLQAATAMQGKLLSLRAQLRVWDKHLFSVLSVLSSSRVDDLLVTRVGEAANLAEVVQRELGLCAGRLREGLERLRGIIELKKRAEAEAATAAAKQRAERQLDDGWRV